MLHLYTVAQPPAAPTPAAVARAFIIPRHYTQGCSRSPVPFATFDERGEMRAVAAFACPGSEAVRAWPFGVEHRDRVTELHRLVAMGADEWPARPDNLLSWSIPRYFDALLELRPHIRCVVSYADSTEGHIGSVYRATNALYFGTVRNNGKSYRGPDGRLHSPRQCGKNITDEEAAALGWVAERRRAKHRYLWIIGPNRRERAYWLRKLVPVPIPYTLAGHQ